MAEPTSSQQLQASVVLKGSRPGIKAGNNCRLIWGQNSNSFQLIHLSSKTPHGIIQMLLSLQCFQSRGIKLRDPIKIQGILDHFISKPMQNFVAIFKCQGGQTSFGLNLSDSRGGKQSQRITYRN